MSCTPSYETEDLPVNPAICGTPCQGCDFDAIVAASCQGGSCSFRWTVQRTGCANSPDDTFAGSATLSPGENRNVDFYCDGAEACARFRLKLMCTAGSPVQST